MNKPTTCLFSLAAVVLLTGCIPLQQAAMRGDTTKVQQLLDKGTDVNVKDFGNQTALIYAAARGHSETVELLLNRGADINAANRSSETALMRASGAGHIDCVRVLLAHGANIDQRNRHGQNALDFARKKGHPDIVQLIAAASRKGAAGEAAPPSVPATLSPPAESAAPF